MAIPIFVFYRNQLIDLLTPTFITIGLVLLFIGIYVYAGITNNNISVKNDSIEVYRKLPFFKRTVFINFSEIEEITMRHDWTETVLKKLKPSIFRYIIVEWFLQTIFPPDYKWIKFKTRNGILKFHCFGIDYDYYDNPEPYFEHLFVELANKNLPVMWTKNSDPYFNDLQRTKIK